MSWFTIWVIIYVAVIAFFTIKHLKNKSIDVYLINNRNTKTLPLVFTILATFVGGGASMGLMAMGYESGFAAVIVGMAFFIGFFILQKYAAKIHSLGVELNIYSFPEFLNRAFLKRHRLATFPKLFSSLVSGVNIFIFFFLLAAQFVGMATLLKFSFDMNYIPAAVLSCVIVIAYTALAGLGGVILTDTIQFVVIIIMMFFIFIPGSLADTEYLTLLPKLPKELLYGTAEGIPFMIAVPIFVSWSVLVRPDIWQRLLAANSDKTAKKVSVWSAIGMFPFYILFPLVGMAVRLTHEGAINPKDAPYLFLEAHSNEFVLGFAVVGLLAALMSSGDSFLNVISLTAVRDFEGWRSTDIPKSKLKKYIIMATVAFGFVAMVIALNFSKIVDLMVVGLSTISIFVPVTLLALKKKNAYRYKYVAFGSLLSGFIVNFFFFIWGVINPEAFNPKSSFIPAFIIATIYLLIGVKLVNQKQNVAKI